MQVCAVKNATDDEILKVCNEKNPAGTTLGWREVVRSDEDDLACGPVQCLDYSDRIHILVRC